MNETAKVYTVNGAIAGSSSSLPDWLVRKRNLNAKGKRVIRERVEGTIELIQGFEFPEASNRVKTTRDGQHVIATGTYKPQMRVWDLHELSLKFERHSDAENVDFVMLSDDWTKSIHLQNDRTIELHAQGGLHYRTRIPRFGRSLAYNFVSCDTYFSASGNEIYRLNLDQGRFMSPLQLEDDGEGELLGVNTIDINPTHQLLAFGIDGQCIVQFWDPRSRSRVGILSLPKNRIVPSGWASGDSTLGITAISSRTDGLSYAIGTSTGHVLLYDIRSTKPFAMKDQGYGLPIPTVSWIERGGGVTSDGLVLSADKKVIKIWDRNSPTTNFATVTPANDLNDVHHIRGSGLLLTANEGIQMATYFIPQLGPAPKWASFLENITEEMEDQTTRSLYEDFKFVERKELKTLGLDHLVGTSALKPYMHGYFISLKLYDTARVIANPFAYAEHREKLIREKIEKLADTRIRSKKQAGVKVNKSLAEKILKEEEKAQKREERKRKRKSELDDVGQESPDETDKQPTILQDPRFSAVFENPEFAIDENSREFALLNPSTAAQRSGKTAVEEEESDRASSDSHSESESDSESNTSDSSDAGDLTNYDPRTRPGQKNSLVKAAYERDRAANRAAKVNLVPMHPWGEGSGTQSTQKNATFGQRKQSSLSIGVRNDSRGEDGAMEISWIPESSKKEEVRGERGGKTNNKTRKKGVETFGAGMERGGEAPIESNEFERSGRTHRRKVVRSGSKNVFRKM